MSISLTDFPLSPNGSGVLFQCLPRVVSSGRTKRRNGPTGSVTIPSFLRFPERPFKKPYLSGDPRNLCWCRRVPTTHKLLVYLFISEIQFGDSILYYGIKTSRSLSLS